MAKQVLFLAAFVFLYAGAWAQSSTTIASASGDALHLEVRGVDDASVSATPVERTSPNGKQLYCAYDIDITKDGREWQPEPEQPAMVTMENPDFADGQLLDIYHEGANGLEFVATVASENGKITFPAHSFSVYIVAQAPEYNRLKVVLHRADHTEVTIYVKKFDLEQGDEFFNRVVYNPGLGTPDAGVKCLGWIAKANYTRDDVSHPLDYAQVRDSIARRLNAGVTDGEVLDFYTMLFKTRSVTYLDHNEAVTHTDLLLFRVNEDITTVDYIVNVPYTTDDSHKFLGWKINPEHNDGINIDGYEENANNYPNNTQITITGDVVFDVNLIKGNWLVFDENGKGGTYNAPQFVLTGHTTTDEDLLAMERYGYTFDGWYTDSLCTTGSEFSFGGEISARTNIYAKWKPNERAPYMIIMWTQNLSRTGYEVKASYVNANGTVGQYIPYESVDYGDEDYARNSATFGNGVLSTNTDDRSYEEVLGHYRGFCLTDASKNQHVTITPEGDAVLNLYYDRIEYNFKFYLYRDAGSNKYDYANNSGTGSDYQTGRNNLVTWYTGQSQHPSVTGYDIQSERGADGKTYYYFAIHAYYGEDISSKWPTYSQITGANGRDPVSFVMMVGTKLKPVATSTGSGTVKGVVSVLNSNILGATNRANGNYVVVRFPGGNINNWRYHIWFETIDGVDYSDRNTYRYNDKTYYEETIMEVRSSNTDVSSQNEPKYNGFTFLGKKNRDWGREEYWTSGSNPTLYHLNFVYDREQYKITYFDGKYTNGNNGQIQNKSDMVLHEGAIKGQGAALAAEDSTYVPRLPEGEDGYIFEGWYLDEGCTTTYTWTTMPVGGIKVYAKWRQIQYRVFLHPNVPVTDSTLDWGSSRQTMCFRIDYNNKISIPKGIREEYEQVGWYTDEACTHVFNSDLVLNESTVTTPYIKATDMTDYMNKWGIIRTDTLPAYNSDTIGNNGGDRFWITKKFDLYAKWRAKLRGANGITVVYDGGEGTPATDTAKFLYNDGTPVVAASACTSSAPGLEFSHWKLLTWNGSDYVETGTNIYPDATFIADWRDAKTHVLQWYNPTTQDVYPGDFDTTKTVDPDPDDVYSECLATYTLMLRAEYVKVQKPTYTFIQWFKNDGTNERIDGTSASNPTLAINDAVLPPVPTRTGYNFKGWYRQRVASGDAPATVAECTPNLLYYNNGSYYKEAEHTNQVTYVAADMFEPTDYMYAIWEPIVNFTIPENTCQGEPITLPHITVDGVELAGTWSADAGTVSGTTYTATDVTSATLTFTPESSTCARANRFPVSFITPNLATASSYDYIWKGSTADWNTNSNWYVYDSRNSRYSIATEQPTAGKNIYIGPSQCVTANWPSQSNEAFAKNITIASTATLTVPEGKTLNIAGNLDNIGTLRASGTVVFCGPSSDGGDQIITNNVEFKNVVFNNLGGNIRPRGNVEINGEATFTSGILEIEAVKFNANSTAVVSSHRSFVSGRVEKTVGELNENFTFPTGSHASGQPDVLGSVSSELPKEKTISVTFYQKSANNGDGTLGFTIDEYPRWWNVADMCPGNGPQLDHVSNYEYWKVNTDVDLVATLTVDAANASAHFGTPNVYSSDMVYAAMYTGGCWKNISNEHGTISDNHQSMSVVANIPRVSLRADEPQIVTLGSTDRSTLLPIELLSFDAECNGNSVELAWATASEKNNDYFSLERSDDAINFTEIARIAGAGNSIERLDYSYTDFGVHGGDNYYRLVQVDYDGTRTASEIIVANCSDMPTEEPEVVAYPNPFNSDLTVELENFGDRPARIDVYDVLGRLVYTEEVAAPQNDYQTVLHLGGLSDATYTVRVATSDFVINRKVVKQQ